MSFSHPQSHQLRIAILYQVFCLLYSSNHESPISLTENLDFASTSGPIEARQFLKIQTRARPEPDPTRKARVRLTTTTQGSNPHFYTVDDDS